MIRFLRHIRRQLMQKNKVTSYLLYALGEIILVVIGILIALEVNNRNELGKSRALEVKYLKEVRENLLFDLGDVSFNINFNRGRLASNKAVLAYLNGEDIDSLSFHLSNMVFTTRTLPNRSGYESLKSKGLELITNDSLRSQITTLYEFHLHNLVDFETKDDFNFQYHQFQPEVMKSVLIEYGDIRETLVPKGVGEFIDPNGVRQNQILKNVIMTNISLRSLMVSQYEDVEQKILTTITMIETELKKLE